MLANRLKNLLPSIISEEQSAFIPGRLITDNVIAAFEVNHWMRRKTQGKMGYAALKIDMSKPYDRVEWDFVRGIMQKLSFNRKWIDWISLFMQSVKCNFLVSGNEIGPIIPSRGLRQGDPISPYLFLLCAEGLSAMIKRRMVVGEIHGCKIAQRAPIISHLFFADDCYLFFRASIEEARSIKNCLREYEKATGQLVNYQKSSIHFSTNTHNSVVEAVSQYLQVQTSNDNFIYLGLPSSVGRNKGEIFSYVKEKVWGRMQSWKGKIVSRGGKEVLLKSVIQVIPSYVMGVFLLPQKLCDELEVMMNKFWWVSDIESKGIRWMSWERMCYPKKFGGMGFRRVRQFNLAMLGKQVWRIMTDSQSLVTRLLKARYFSAVTFGEAVIGHNPSYIWRSLLEARDMVFSGSRIKVGTGESINVWTDPWIPDAENAMINTPMPSEFQHIKVKDLICQEDQTWDIQFIRDIFVEQDVERILRIPRSGSKRKDQWFWIDDENDSYTVKTGYKRLMGNLNQQVTNTGFVHWQKLWNMHIPPKVKNFIWRVVRNCLPTLDNLQQKYVEVNSQCSVCRAAEENLDHIIWKCPFSRRCWEETGMNIQGYDNQNITQVLSMAFQNWSHKDIEILSMVAWSLWSHRNAVAWHASFQTAQQIVQSAGDFLDQWKKAQSNTKGVVRNRWEGSAKWNKPQHGWTSCNVDAAISVERKMSSFGCLLRNEEGGFVAGCGCTFTGDFDPKIAEAMDFREALSWVKGKGMDKVAFELDSLLVIQACSSKRRVFSYFGDIIEDCLSICKDLRSYSVSFVRRSANMAAHRIAREAISVSECKEWNLVPPFLSNVILQDLA